MARGAPQHRPHHYRTKQEKRKEVDQRRGSSTARGYGYRWQKAREVHLAAHPLCVHCEEEGKTTAATDVDHIKPHKGDMDLFWDERNWQSLCSTHHKKKTMKEGAFGQ